MLHDRRVLVEEEIAKLTSIAADIYLQTVTVGGTKPDAEYFKLQNQITELQFDLKMINKLIAEGRE